MRAPGLVLLSLILLGLGLPMPGRGAAPVVDDWGRQVHMPAPARRIAALAPHLVEMLYEIGAGDRIVATVAWADYPPAANAIPRIGDAFSLSREALLAARPDLVLLWGDAASPDDVRFAEGIGAQVFVSAPGTLEGIAANLRSLAALTGSSTENVAWFDRRAHCQRPAAERQRQTFHR